MSDELREKVAKCLFDCTGNADWNDLWLEMADAAIALVLEEAAKVADGMPINGHGNLAVDPYAAAKQVSDEIAAAIRALGEKA